MQRKTFQLLGVFAPTAPSRALSLDRGDGTAPRPSIYFANAGYFPKLIGCLGENPTERIIISPPNCNSLKKNAHRFYYVPSWNVSPRKKLILDHSTLSLIVYPPNRLAVTTWVRSDNVSRAALVHFFGKENTPINTEDPFRFRWSVKAAVLREISRIWWTGLAW